jgi:predicted Zn-dependent peptidase
LDGDRRFRLFPCHECVYTIGRMSVFARHVLDNGLRVITADLPHAQSVTCMVMIAAGSRYETAETNGIAHFAEHMFFKGTERRPNARAISMEIDAVGGEFNAFTGKESTAYFVRCAAEHRDVALDVLVDMLRHSRFDGEEIEREKGVIVEEMNMYFDTPRDFIGGVYEELLYGDQPLGWDILGRKETVRAATRETFLSYLGRWYHPERMVVGIAGRIGDDAVERVSALLGDMPTEETGTPDPLRPQADGRVKLFTKASDQAHVILGVPSYPLDHPDRYALQMVATVLGGGMSSRLFTEVRERRGLAYYVYGLNHSYTDAGSLYSQAGVDIERIDDAVGTIAGELRGIAESPVPADELEKARNFAKGRFVLQLESPQGLIMFGLRKEVLERRMPDPDEVIAGVDAVTAEDVQRVAQDVIADDRLRLAVIGPFDDVERFEKLL